MPPATTECITALPTRSPKRNIKHAKIQDNPNLNPNPANPLNRHASLIANLNFQPSHLAINFLVCGSDAALLRCEQGALPEVTLASRALFDIPPGGVGDVGGLRTSILKTLKLNPNKPKIKPKP